MEIERFEADMNIIQQLGNHPNLDNEMSAEEVKAKFDEAGNLIKDYINETVVPAVDKLYAQATTTSNLVGEIHAKTTIEKQERESADNNLQKNLDDLSAYVDDRFSNVINDVRFGCEFKNGILVNSRNDDPSTLGFLLLEALRAGKELFVYEKFQTGNEDIPEEVVDEYNYAGHDVGRNENIVFQRNDDNKLVTVIVSCIDGAVSKTETAYSTKEVVNAEYDYETKELLSNFYEMCTAFLAGKIVTLSATDSMGVKETYYCKNYETAETSGYEGSCLIFTQAGPTYTKTLYVTDEGVVGEYTAIIGGGGSVELDTTLTVPGKAADAKAVGDKILEVYQAADVAVNTALDKKLDKVTITGEGVLVYGISNQGKQTIYSTSSGAHEKTVAFRGTGGVLGVGAPTADHHAVPKKYVDDLLKESSESAVFDVHYIPEIDTIDCSFADAVNAFREGKIVRFRISHDECKDYYCTYYCDIVEPTMRFVGSFGDNIETVCLTGDGSFSTHTGRLITDDEYSDLLSRIEALESGSGGDPGGEGGEFYIDGTSYWIDYPKTFEEMINSGIPSDLWVESIINPGEMVCYIGIDYENFAVFWNEIDQDGAMQPVGHIYFNGQTGWVSPDIMVYPGEEYIVVRDI